MAKKDEKPAKSTKPRKLVNDEKDEGVLVIARKAIAVCGKHVERGEEILVSNRDADYLGRIGIVECEKLDEARAEFVADATKKAAAEDKQKAKNAKGGQLGDS